MTSLLHGTWGPVPINRGHGSSQFVPQYYSLSGNPKEQDFAGFYIVQAAFRVRHCGGWPTGAVFLQDP